MVKEKEQGKILFECSKKQLGMMNKIIHLPPFSK
jgi:hypothetical protein